MAFRSGTSTRLDDRIFAMFQLKILPLTQLIQMIYPDLYPLHKLDDRNYKEIDGRICPQSRRLHLSAEKLESPGVFLMDAGDKIFIYVCRNVSPIFCSNVFGVPEFASIPEEFVSNFYIFIGYVCVSNRLKFTYQPELLVKT